MGTGCLIKPCTAAEILSPANAHLIEEYSAESAIAGMPHTVARLEAYRKLEEAGMMRCYGAYDGPKLIGFTSVLISVLPHYGAPTAIVESIFVQAQSRKGGAGTLLLKTVEQHARERGAVGILISAPVDGSLSRLLGHDRSGYRHTNQVFFRSTSV